VVLRQPDSTQAESFRGVLTCVRLLPDLTLIVKYRSHTPETISYMEEYEMQYHEMKNMFL